MRLSVIGLLAALVLTACFSATPNVDPDPVEAAIRADPHVAALRTAYSPASFERRAHLDLQVDLRPDVGADGVVGTVSRAAAELLRADGFDQISWILTFRSSEAPDTGSLRIESDGGGTVEVPAVDPEARRWAALTARYPGADVRIDLAQGGLWRRATLLRVPDHDSVTAAFAGVAAEPTQPALRGDTVEVGVASPDPARSAVYSSDGTAPPDDVVRTMRALTGIADPAPAGLGVELSVTWSARSPAASHVDVLVDLAPEEYRQIPVNQINAMLPGTSTDLVAREYERVLDGSGSRFRLRVRIHGSDPYICRDAR